MNNTLDKIHTSGSLGEKAEIFQSGNGNVSGFPSPALIPLRAPLLTPNAQKNRTTLCKGNRYDSFSLHLPRVTTVCLQDSSEINSAALKLKVILTTVHFTMCTLCICRRETQKSILKLKCRLCTCKHNWLNPNAAVNEV